MLLPQPGVNSILKRFWLKATSIKSHLSGYQTLFVFNGLNPRLFVPNRGQQLFRFERRRLFDAEGEALGWDFFDDGELGAVGLPGEFVRAAVIKSTEVAFFVPGPFVLFGHEGAGFGFKDGDFEQVFGFDENDGAEVFVEFAHAVNALVPNRKDFVADL